VKKSKKQKEVPQEVVAETPPVTEEAPPKEERKRELTLAIESTLEVTLAIVEDPVQEEPIPYVREKFNVLNQDQVREIVNEYEEAATFHQTYSSFITIVDFCSNKIKPKKLENGKPPAELKLLAAVVALAVKDLAKPPYQSVRGSRSRYPDQRMVDEAISACNFLFSDACRGYLEMLDMDVKMFRKNLFKIMADRRPVNIGDLSPMQRRYMAMNYKIWQLSSEEYLNADLHEELEHDER